MLQLILLIFGPPVLRFDPAQVRNRQGIIWSDVAKVIDEGKIELGVIALLGFGDGQAIGLDGEVRRVGADMVESIYARYA